MLDFQSPHMRVARGGPMMLAHIGIVRAMNRLVPEPPFMRARSRRAAGLSEVQEGGKAAPCDIAAAYAALAPAVSGTKRKLKSDFRCYPNNGHAATASAGPFCATTGLMQCNKSLYSITSSARSNSPGGMERRNAFAVFRLRTSSNLLGRSIGRSAGFVPCRILPLMTPN